MQSVPCRGVLYASTEISLLIQSQENFNDFIHGENNGRNYCEILESVKNGSNSFVKLEGLMGFFLPRADKSSTETVFPTAFYYSSNDGKNQFRLISYKCVENKNAVSLNEETCQECKTLWRSFRNNTSVNYVKTIEHTRILKKETKKFLVLDSAFTEHKNVEKKKWSLIHKQQNKLIKKASYWKNKCRSIEEAVDHWRNVESERDGMITVGDEEAIKWESFYEFIDAMIDKEHFDSPEKRELHKELIRSETSTLGKFNKRQDKRGIRNTKISSRVLNYSLTLANNLGKVNYENEALLRSLPSWSTLTRYV